MSLVLGCDLGTTYSVMCQHVKGKPVFSKDDSGSILIPSVVCFTDEIKIGYDAIDAEEDHPNLTVRSSKRSIGTKHNVLNDGDLNFNATEVASKILSYLKEISEKHFNDTVDSIVITVPAYFNHNQRLETKKAAESAGMKVLRIINEPTAAAIAYGDNTNKNELVLVYDLGGGTFDVTLLQLTDDNVYQVLSTSGDSKLGGDDFDDLIAERFKSTLPENFKPFKDFEVRLKKFAEEVKIKINYKKEIVKTLKYCGSVDSKIFHHEMRITQDDYRQMINSILVSTKRHMLDALNSADKKISQLSKIILVGGSTKSIFVREYIKSQFDAKIHYDIDPDLTVAAGAAKLAHSLSSKDGDSTVLIDVTPLSLGIEVKGGLLNKIIPRNSTVPITVEQDYITAEDNQSSVTISIFQDERIMATDNAFLGEFELSGFELRSRKQKKIVVKFDIDVSGLITVTAFDKMSGLQSSVVIHSLSSDRVNEYMDDLEGNYLTEREISLKSELSSLQDRAKALILKSVLNGGDENELNDIYKSVSDDIGKIQVFIQSFFE